MIRKIFINLLFTIFVCSFLSIWPPLSNGQQTKKVPIRMGMDVATAALPFWVAEQENIFDKYGLEVTSRLYELGFMGLLAIGANEGDTSIQTELPTIINISKGIDAIIVALVASGNGIYKAVVKKEIKNPTDLIGKKVGVPFGSGGEFFMHQWLKINKIKIDQIKLQNSAPPELGPMLYKGDIDAVFLWEPWPRNIMKLDKGGEKLHILGYRGDPHIFLTVRRKFADENPEAVKNLLKALIESNSFVSKNREKALKITKYILRTTSEEADAAINDHTTTVMWDDQTTADLIELAQWLKEQGRIKEIPDWGKIIVLRYLKEVDPNRVQIKLK